jgi:hypothetical protein
MWAVPLACGVAELKAMMTLLQLSARVVVGSTLIIAAVAKLANFRWFVGTLATFKLWGASLNSPVAVAVIALELLAAVPLLFLGNHGAAWLAVALFLVFGTMTTRNLIKRKFDSKCGCFGPNGKTASWQLLLRNVGWAGLAWLITVPVKPGLMLVFWILSIGLLCFTLISPNHDRVAEA